MTDEPGNSDQERKVVRLFPGREREESGGLERGPAFDWEDVDAVEREIHGVLRAARKNAAVDAELLSVPDPSHRNAVRCPQCDGLTWRRTPVCRHCGADLAVLAAERRQALLWCGAIASWGVALGCFYLNQHYVLPPKLHTVLNIVALSIAAGNAFAFWIASLGEKR